MQLEEDKFDNACMVLDNPGASASMCRPIISTIFISVTFTSCIQRLNTCALGRRKKRSNEKCQGSNPTQVTTRPITLNIERKQNDVRITTQDTTATSEVTSSYGPSMTMTILGTPAFQQ